MTPEDTIICLSARQNFDAEHQQRIVEICRLKPIRWDKVFATSQLHQISPIVYSNLSRISSDQLQMPPVIRNRFIKAHYRNILTKKKTERVLEQILAFASRKKLSIMIVKGEAVSRLTHTQPWHTVSYDVDLVVRSDERELGEEDRREIVTFLAAFNKNRSEFEEHIEYDFDEHHDMTMNGILTVDWDRIWAEAETLQIGGHEACVMSIEDTLLAAAINSCRKRFYRLKSLFDIAAILDSHPNLNWATIIRKAHAYRCDTILYTALVVAESVLGCRPPDGILAALGINPIRAALIRFLVSQLSKRLTMSQLFVKSRNATFSRALSWTLLLTYATYRIDHLGPKVRELYAAWRNPPPEVSLRT
jgi:hypothetical protein